MSELKNIIEVAQEENDEVDTNTKKVSLYALDAGDITKKRLTATSAGTRVGLDINNVGGLYIPAHDTQVIDATDANNTTITYKKGGVTVAVKTIAVSGSITTISVS